MDQAVRHIAPAAAPRGAARAARRLVTFGTVLRWSVIQPHSCSFAPTPSCFIPFLISINLKDLVFFFNPPSTWMGTLVFSANNVGSVIIRAFLPSFVFLCGFVPYCPFSFDTSSFSVIFGKTRIQNSISFLLPCSA